MVIHIRKTFFIIFCLCAISTFISLTCFSAINFFQHDVKVLLVDETKILTEAEQYKNAYKKLPSFPIEFWINNSKKTLQLNKSCAKFPSLFDVEFQNIYWQNFISSNGHYQLFGAYLDDRKANPLGPTVRVLGMLDQVEPIQTVYCQMWFNEKVQPVIVKASKYNYAWLKGLGNDRKGFYQAYLIPCPIPKEYHNLKVSVVSLVENKCDTANNAFTVFYNKPVKEKHDFAVCVKGMDFMLEDISSVLTEWIEMMLLLGAHKIFVYDLHVHPNVSKVLQYYENLGHVEVTPLTLPAGRPNTPYWQHMHFKHRVTIQYQDEIVPYNDCFYKHMYEYKYIALLDIDELIVPLNSLTWRELFDHFNRTLDKKYDSYNARHVHFQTDLLFKHKWFKDIPEYMHILNHVYRSPTVFKHRMNVKTFYNTETVLTLQNHYPFLCFTKECKNYSIDPKDALMQHYQRKTQDVYNKFRNTSIMQTTVWKYKKDLIERVTKALTDMGFLVSAKVLT